MPPLERGTHRTSIWSTLSESTNRRTYRVRYIRQVPGGDHAWGGGADIKYFFMRYFGVGIEGFGLNAKRNTFDIDFRPLDGVFFGEKGSDERIVGSIMGTFTLRYPIPCSRFAPYVWAGGGAIFNGGERDTLTTEAIPGVPDHIGDVPNVNATTHHFGSTTGGDRPVRRRPRVSIHASHRLDE